MDCPLVPLVLYNEARNSEENMRAVAHVILNRAKKLNISPCVVVSIPNQFDTRIKTINETKRWHLAQKIALNPGPDPTNGATFFHNSSVRPSWSYKFKVTYRVANHIFYKEAR